MAFARMKPPMNRKIIGLAKGANALTADATPVSTHRMGPMREVTAMGSGSVIHHKHTS